MKESNNPEGIGFFGLLTLLFIGLKLGGVIAWSWVWVLSPIWFPIACLILLGAVIWACFFIYERLES